MTKPLILLVDDERFFRDSLAKYLSTRYRILSASNGNEAMRAINENRDINLIISDMEMPEMNGIELLEKLNHDKLDIPTIVLTGSATMNKASAVMRLGAYDYLTKPVDLDQLESSIKRAIHRCKALI